MKFNATEEELMKYLWKLDSAYLKDLVDQYPEPKPAYTTIATLVSRMIKKGYIDYHQRGSNREYYAKIRKSDYFSGQLKYMIRNFFNNSAAQFGSFFASKSELSTEELEELKSQIDKELSARKEAKND